MKCSSYNLTKYCQEEKIDSECVQFVFENFRNYIRTFIMCDVNVDEINCTTAQISFESIATSYYLWLNIFYAQILVCVCVEWIFWGTFFKKESSANSLKPSEMKSVHKLMLIRLFSWSRRNLTIMGYDPSVYTFATLFINHIGATCSLFIWCWGVLYCMYHVRAVFSSSLSGERIHTEMVNN